MLIQKLPKTFNFFLATRSSRLFCVAKAESAISPEKKAFPPEKVEILGQSVDYPWKGGAWEKYYTPQLWARMQECGALTADGNFKPWLIKDPDDRQKMKLLWSEKLAGGKGGTEKGFFYDFNKKTVLLISVFAICTILYQAYWFVVPTDKNIFMYENWKRWHYEHH